MYYQARPDPPPPPPPDRFTALLHLAGMVPYIQTSFFTASKTRHPDLTVDFQGFPLIVKKRTLSLADPSNVAYEIRLGTLYPRGTALVATVLYPKADPEANRAAFKRCVEQLAWEPAREMSDMEA
ncbi:hypothetical protein V8D89_005199 [Ganoderma adspersum]